MDESMDEWGKHHMVSDKSFISIANTTRAPPMQHLWIHQAFLKCFVLWDSCGFIHNDGNNQKLMDEYELLV